MVLGFLPSLVGDNTMAFKHLVSIGILGGAALTLLIVLF
jgi:hypothetical protein